MTKCDMNTPAASSLLTHMSAQVCQSRSVGPLHHLPPEVTGTLCWREWQRL